MSTPFTPPAPASRPVFVFDLPIGEDGQPLDTTGTIRESIGMVKLTLDEELAAIARAAGDSIKMAYFTARASLVEVDGRRLNKAEAEDEKVMRAADPMVRGLIVAAYSEISSVSEGTQGNFLKTKRIKIGG